jgi:hypothetical protein
MPVEDLVSETNVRMNVQELFEQSTLAPEKSRYGYVL